MLRDPVGHAAAGPHHLMWCVDPELTGISLWGYPTGDEMTELIEVLAAPHSEALHLPCDMILDGRYLQGMSADAFEVVVRGARRHHAEIGRRARRQALVRPDGVVGALFAGFNALLSPGYRWQVFASLPEALDWLHRSDGELVSAAVASLVSVNAQASPLVTGLRAWLRARQERAAVSDAARALAVSVRSLQRHLAEHGTSFRALAEEIAVEQAEALLVEPGMKIERIADCAGGTSRETLIRRFRRRRGVTPSEWRRRHRTA